MVIFTAKEFSNILTAVNIKDNGEMAQFMEEELWYTMNLKNMRVSLWMDKERERVYIFLGTVDLGKDNGWAIFRMEKGNI